MCVFMCDSLRRVNWSCSKRLVPRTERLAIGGRPKEKVRDEALLCSGTTEHRQTREEEQSLFPYESRDPRESLQLPALCCLMNFQQLMQKYSLLLIPGGNPRIVNTTLSLWRTPFTRSPVSRKIISILFPWTGVRHMKSCKINM